MEHPTNATNWTSGQFKTNHDRDGSRLAYLTVQVGIAFAGFFANIIVVATIISSKKLQRSINYHLILNLSISDIGILVFTFPFVVNIQEDGPWPEFVCLWFYPLSDIFQGVSFWTIAAIAISRYRTVCGTFTMGKTTLMKTKLLIGAIWFVSLTLVALPVKIYMKYRKTSTSDLCYPDFPEIEGYEKLFIHKLYAFLIRIGLVYVFPLATIMVTYIYISIYISKATRQLKEIIKGRQVTEQSLYGVRIRSALSRNSRAKKLLTPLVLVFTVTVFPFNLLRVLQFYLNISYYYRKVVWIVCVVFLILHCAINPLLYCIVNPDFYRATKQLPQKILRKMQLSRLLVISAFSQQEERIELNS